MVCYRLPLAKYMEAGASTSFGISGTAVGASYVSAYFSPIPGGTITGVLFYTATTNGTTKVVFSLENKSGFVPSGTLVSPGAIGTLDLFGGTFWIGTFGTPYNVPTNTGSALHLVVRRHSGTLTSIFSRKANPTHSMPRTIECAGTTVTQRLFSPAVTPIYSDGTYSHDIAGPSTNNTAAFNNTSSPNEYGNMFIPDDTFLTSAVRLNLRMSHADSKALIRLYDASLNVLTDDNICTIPNVASSISDVAYLNVNIGTQLKLYRGSTYYVTYTATGTTIYYNSLAYPDAVLRDINYNGHQGCIRTGGTGTFAVFAGSTNCICVMLDCLPENSFVPERDVALGTTYTWQGDTFTGSLNVGGGTGGTTIINNYYGVSRSRVGGGL